MYHMDACGPARDVRDVTEGVWVVHGLHFLLKVQARLGNVVQDSAADHDPRGDRFIHVKPFPAASKGSQTL